MRDFFEATRAARPGLALGVVVCLLGMASALAACDGGEGEADTSGPDSVADATPDAGGDATPDTTADATPDATPDATGDAVPDTTSDAVSDGGPPPHKKLALSAATIASACETACADDGGNECDLSPLGGSPEACLAQCKSKAAGDGWWLGAFYCYDQICDAEACGLNAAVPATSTSDCDDTCSRLDDCDFLSVVDLPEDQPDACRAFCAGITAGKTPVAEGVPCIAVALSSECSLQDLAACLPVESTATEAVCEDTCERFFIDESTNADFCAAGTGLRAAWPELSQCVSACMEFDTEAQATRMMGCLLASDCPDPTACLTVPDTDEADCVAGCEALGTLCAGPPLGADQEGCQAVCTGYVQGSGGATDSAVETCLSTLDGCPADQGAQVDALLKCVLPKAQACSTVCEAVVPCSTTPGLSVDYCEGQCTFGKYGSGVALSELSKCMGATEACLDVAKCLDPDGPDPVCAARCGKLLSCGQPNDPDCQASCEAGLKANPKALATAVCEVLSPCDDQDVCQSLVDFEAPTSCVTACEDAPGTCNEQPGGCANACMGALTGLSLVVAAAPCVVGELGGSCDAEAALSCK